MAHLDEREGPLSRSRLVIALDDVGPNVPHGPVRIIGETLAGTEVQLDGLDEIGVQLAAVVDVAERQPSRIRKI
jgi:hypothetical protein